MPTKRRGGAGSVWATHVRLVLDKPEIEYIFLRVLQCFPVNIIPPNLHNHHYLSTTISRRKTQRTWEFTPKKFSFVYRRCMHRVFKYTLPAFREALILLCTVNIICLLNCSKCKSYIHRTKSYDKR